MPISIVNVQLTLVADDQPPATGQHLQAIDHRLKPHFWAGIALLAAGHFLIVFRWSSGEHFRPWSDYWFAAIWFGYIFALDALLYRRDGRSLIVTYRPVFIAMLPLSAALWFGFEWINGFVHNWWYERPYDIPEWWAQLWSAIFFSTVIPAVWLTTTWVRGWRWVEGLRRHKGFTPGRFLPVAFIALGVVAFALPVVWPLYFFGLIWGFMVLILDPLNYLRGVPSILGHLARGDWRVPVSVYIAGQICGVFWEAWNFWAFPKWHYTIPFVGFWKIFEMPLLGYLGYGPFAWEVYAVCQFTASLLPVLKSLRSTSRAQPDRAEENHQVGAPEEPASVLGSPG